MVLMNEWIEEDGLASVNVLVDASANQLLTTGSSQEAGTSCFACTSSKPHLEPHKPRQMYWTGTSTSMTQQGVFGELRNGKAVPYCLQTG
jgi:hypothetical protein